MENNEYKELLKDILKKTCLQNDLFINALSAIETINDDDVKKDAIVEVVNAQQSTTKFIAELLVKYLHD